MTDSPYRSIEDVRQADRDRGGHWFDAGTMRFFGTRFCGPLIGGRWFVTSERRGFSDSGRAYTVRYARDGGNVETVGGFGEYDSARQATAAIRRFVKLGAGPCQTCQTVKDPTTGHHLSDSDWRDDACRKMLAEGWAYDVDGNSVRTWKDYGGMRGEAVTG